MWKGKILLIIRINKKSFQLDDILLHDDYEQPIRLTYDSQWYVQVKLGTTGIV